MLGRRFLWAMAILIPFLGWGQPSDRFQALYQSANGNMPAAQASLKMSQFLSGLHVKRAKFKSDELFLRYAFRESHKNFFHNYKAYSQFPEIFDSGYYDCLSATSFFSIVLEEFEFDYKIIETNYHIFLVVDANEKQILLETTDKTYGFVSNDRILKARLNEYRENNLITTGNSELHHYKFDLDIYQQVMPHQLPGLLYFNQAVIAFNNKDYAECALKIKKARSIYTNPRILELIIILVAEVAESDLEEVEKRKLIRPFASFIKERASVVAAR